MKTIDELAQVLLTVDNKLDLVLLGDENTRLLVDDDLHRELYAAVAEACARPDVLVYESIDDEGGHFQMPGDPDFALAYQYSATEGVLWYYADMREVI